MVGDPSDNKSGYNAEFLLTVLDTTFEMATFIPHPVWNEGSGSTDKTQWGVGTYNSPRTASLFGDTCLPLRPQPLAITLRVRLLLGCCPTRR